MTAPRPAEATVAIATGILGKSTETGARRHVAQLFGGQTVVVCDRIEPGTALLRPTFVCAPSGLPGQVEALAGRAAGHLRFGVPGVPFGRTRRQLEQFLRGQHAVAILCEFGHVACRLAPVGEALGIPVFAYFRGFDASKRLREPKIVRRYAATLPRLAGVFAVSQFLIDNLARHGLRHPRSVVIPTGVDTTLFRPGEKDPNLLLAVGRIIAKKAPLLTLQAFAEAAAAAPAARLEIIGDGEMRADCEAMVAAHGLTDRILFHGARDHDFVRQRLARAGIFLQHSLTDEAGNTEGLPTAIQEAMACGAVVVSTRHAGIPEAVTDGETGLLVAEGDVAGFAGAIARLLADPVGVAAMAGRAREVAVARFDVTRLHARLEGLIAAECARRGLPSPSGYWSDQTAAAEA